MKKLLIAMMSVASLAFISKAEAINSGTTFENYTGAFGADKDDRGGNDGTFWYTAGSQSDCGTLTNTDYTASYTGKRPAIAQGAATATALAVEAEQRLERGIANYSGGFAPQDIGSGIYFDTMVQFTATDTAPTPSQDDKLIVWLYGSAEEDGAFGIGTNLVVTAGYLQAGDIPVASNYVVSVSGVTVEPNSWHRLTIKAIEKVADTVTAPCGFVVFIDEKEATNTEVKWSEESCLATPSAVAGVWAGKNALFPALVDYSSRQLSAVALEGTGMIDDISFTSVAPDFAQDGNLFTLTWGAGLSALTLNGETVADFTAGEEGSTVILVTTPGTTYTLSATPDSANGWAIAGVTAVGGVAYADNTFTVNGIGTGTIATKQACYTVNGAGAFETFDEALAEALKTDSSTISLTADVTECISVAGAEGKAIVLDLAGHDITCITEDGSDPAIVVSSGTLTLIDSVGGGVISSNCEDAAVYGDEEGTIILGAAEGDEGITVDGYVLITGEGLFVCGKFAAAVNSVDEIQEILAEGSTITTDEDYIIVTPGDTPVPTTYTVTVNAGTGTTVPDAPTKPVEENTEVTLTVGLVDGYKNLVVTVNDEETSVVDGKVTFTVTADTIVNVSATKMATYTVTIAETLGDNVTSITATPTSIREDAVSKTVTLEATFEDDYELDYFTVDGEKIVGKTFELTANAVVNAVAKKTVGPEPEDWPADPSTVKGQTAGDAFGLTGDMAAAPADKVATWAKAKEVSFADRTTAIKIDAYLLNVDNTDAAIIAGKAAFKFTSITPGETPTIEGTFNGVVVVKAYLDAACTNEGTSEKATFYKATLEVTAPVK